jgi:hypothetical protein
VPGILCDVRLLLAATTLLVSAGLAASTAQSGSNAKPRLVVLDRSPLVVRGLRFRADEDVRVRAIVRGGPRVTKNVVAGGGGVFNVRFASVSFRECGFVTVQATGARGSRASFTHHPPPCGPAP